MAQPPSPQKDKNERQRSQHHRCCEIPPRIENTSNPAVRLRCAANADARQSPKTAQHREKRQNQARPKASPSGEEAPKNGRDTNPNGDKPVGPKHCKGQPRMWWNPRNAESEPTGSEEASQERQNYPTNYGCSLHHRAQYGLCRRHLSNCRPGGRPTASLTLHRRRPARLFRFEKVPHFEPPLSPARNGLIANHHR